MHDVAEALELDTVKKRVWYIQACSASNGVRATPCEPGSTQRARCPSVGVGHGNSSPSFACRFSPVAGWPARGTRLARHQVGQEEGLIAQDEAERHGPRPELRRSAYALCVRAR